MYTPAELEEYMAEIREQVCRHCIEHPPGGPPCAPHGKRCGVELHLSELIEVCHGNAAECIDPYIESFHDDVCSQCANSTTSQCPCPLDYLLSLAVEAIETVDERKRQAELQQD